MSVRFDFAGDYATVISTQAAEAAFESALISTISTDLGIDSSLLSVESISSGSIVVVMSIYSREVVVLLQNLVVTGDLSVVFGGSILSADPKSFVSNVVTTTAGAVSASTSSGAISGGALAGIIIGCVAALVIVVVVLLVYNVRIHAQHSKFLNHPSAEAEKSRIDELPVSETSFVAHAAQTSSRSKDQWYCSVKAIDSYVDTGKKKIVFMDPFLDEATA